MAALVPQCELDALIGSPQQESQSRVMTRALRKIHHSLSLSQTLIVFINQVGTKLQNCFLILSFIRYQLHINSVSLCSIIIYIQVRSTAGSQKSFGHMDEVTCGGNALQFYAAVRLRLLRGGLLKSDDKVNFKLTIVC